VCDSAEDSAGHGAVIVHVSGAPEGAWAGDMPVALVSKWERALRRLERLRTVTIAVAEGDCGGPALDALLATDYRIAANSARFLVTVDRTTIWPGMALYRLCRQCGAATVRRAVLFGTPIEASSALAIGVIDELSGDVSSALAQATDMAGAFPAAELAIRRQLMLDASATSFEDALGVHLAACDRFQRRLASEVGYD
jgi:isomerase DpgB